MSKDPVKKIIGREIKIIESKDFFLLLCILLDTLIIKKSYHINKINKLR